MQAFSKSLIDVDFPALATCFSLTLSLKSSIRSSADGLVFSAVLFARPGHCVSCFGIAVKVQSNKVH